MTLRMLALTSHIYDQLAGLAHGDLDIITENSHKLLLVCLLNDYPTLCSPVRSANNLTIDYKTQAPPYSTQDYKLHLDSSLRFYYC